MIRTSQEIQDYMNELFRDGLNPLMVRSDNYEEESKNKWVEVPWLIRELRTIIHGRLESSPEFTIDSLKSLIKKLETTE